MRAVGYIRVSKVGDRGGERFLSPDLQRESIEGLAKREGLEIVEWIEELDASGGDAKRPGLLRAIELIEAGKADGIAVWALSRFSRRTRDALNAWDRIEAANGRLWSATEPLDNKLLRTILLAVAENERDRAAEGFLAAKLSAVDRGIHLAGHIPLGYVRGADRRLEIDPDTTPIVQGLFERKAKGMSHEALARWVQEQGVEGFSSTGVRWVLGNRVYLGEARGAGKVVEGAHPAIISRALFAKCQTKGIQSQRTGKLAGRFLLQGVARCAGCGNGLRLSTAGDGRAFYRCRTTGCSGRGYAGTERLDAYVLNVLDERIPPDPSTWVPVPGAADEAEIEELELALEEAKADLDGFLADTTLRRSIGPAKHTEAAGNYAAVVAKCEHDLEEARSKSTGGLELVGRLWNTEWGHPETVEWTARMLQAVIVHPGRAKLSERVEVELRSEAFSRRPHAATSRKRAWLRGVVPGHMLPVQLIARTA